MQTSLICLCLCLLSTALATPVKRETPAGAINKRIVGFGYFLPHQIILKGCNAKHGFYMFKYIYSMSARSNQTQIK
ncbi:OC116 protein, partial [Paradoxornis webbianus]|nr:OC116 protein [Sinosuthora webbiana]